MCRMLGRPREELIGHSIASITPAEDVIALRRTLEQMLRGELDSFTAEQRFVRGDGSVAWGLLHWAPVRREDGSVEAFHSQLVDITDRKEREFRLEHDVGEALWLGRIRDALDEDRFVLYAQPIVDLTTGQTVQHELLLRMRGEDGEIIAPASSCRAAERYGLVSEIDRWVIRQAVQIAAAGAPTEFNLSGRSIGDPVILRELATAIEESGVDPTLLVVEVTETAFVGQTEACCAFAEHARSGIWPPAGPSMTSAPASAASATSSTFRPTTSRSTSSSYATSPPHRILNARVVRGIVALAHEFKQTTIAEGVEDEATLIMLREMGVDLLAQGYLFGRPAPLAAPAVTPPAPRHCPPRAEGPAFEDAIRHRHGPRSTPSAAWDVPAMIARCHPDFVLRWFATSQKVDRAEPYRGHDGLLAYLRDVATVWDELKSIPASPSVARRGR